MYVCMYVYMYVRMYAYMSCMKMRMTGFTHSADASVSAARKPKQAGNCFVLTDVISFPQSSTGASTACRATVYPRYHALAEQQACPIDIRAWYVRTDVYVHSSCT